MSNKNSEPEKTKMVEEITDLEDRLNDLELQMVDAKEFTHISSDAFEALQSQIIELREMLEQLILVNSSTEQKTDEKIGIYQ